MCAMWIDQNEDISALFNMLNSSRKVKKQKTSLSGLFMNVFEPLIAEKVNFPISFHQNDKLSAISKTIFHSPHVTNFNKQNFLSELNKHITELYRNITKTHSYFQISEVPTISQNIFFGINM